jgi:hypothetical protein
MNIDSRVQTLEKQIKNLKKMLGGVASFFSDPRRILGFWLGAILSLLNLSPLRARMRAPETGS